MKQFPILVTAVTLLSCFDAGGPSFPNQITAGELVWVGKTFVGGQQCTPQEYTPPDAKALLHAAGIGVYETAIEYHAVCAACGCPSYAAMHYALIAKSQLTVAEGLGFLPNNPPSRGG